MLTKVLVVVAAVAVVTVIIGGVIVFGQSSSQPEGTATPTPSVAANSGRVQITDQVVGTGAEAQPGGSVTVKYTGKLADGTVFDSTDKNGGQPVTFSLNSVIKGWQEGIPGMKIGGKRTLVIPPDLAYGDQANGDIPANSTLTFEVELVDVK